MTGVSWAEENRQHWSQTGPATRIVMEYETHTTTNNVLSERFTNNEDSAITINQPLNTSLSGSPCAFSSTRELDRRLEQELMHRWLTRTSWGLYSTPQDVKYLGESLPRAALANSFLIKSLFAITAADMVYSGQRAYMRPALEYHTNAMNDMNLYLSTNGQKNVELLYIFSFFLTVFNFIITTPSSPFNLLTTTFDLLISANNLLLANNGNSRPACHTELLQGLDLRFLHLLDLPTRTALERLTAVSHQIKIQATDDDGNIITQPAGENEIYQAAIRHIKYSFSENARGVFQNHCWSIVLAVNSKFFTAVKQAEPMALLISLYFGALLDRMGRNTKMTWWVGSYGKNLVKEISEMLQHTFIVQVSDGREAIAWARTEVGLP
jgi:hypothetical protein